MSFSVRFAPRLVEPARFRTWVALALIALLTTACDQGTPPLEREARASKFESTDISSVDWGRDFHLTDHRGRPRRLADFSGKVVMMFFGYAHCPDVCPTNLAKMGLAVERLGQAGKQVQGLFVTVDPARDTQAVLAEYVPAFHPTFLGLYGDSATTAATAQEFKTHFAHQAPGEGGFYSVDHGGSIFVFDRSGRLRLLMNADTPVDVMVHDVKALLAE